MDCTPSMRQVIKAAKKKVGEIQRRICSMLGHGGNVRFAIVAYRDHQYRRPIEILPFSTLGCALPLCLLEVGMSCTVPRIDYP